MSAVAAVVALILSACGNDDTPESNDATPLVVWTDATRQPGFEKFQETHPEVDMTIETLDTNTLLSKIQLANRAGEGWPDVVFSQNPADVASLSSDLFKYAQPLDDVIPQEVQKGFGAALDECRVDGTLYCLKNDLAHSVLWYNKSLMDKFGYTVPTTWDEYQQLGLRVASEHPGHIVGTAGFNFVYNDFLWPSGCPLQQITGPNQVHIDVEDSKCTRVAKLLDPLLEAGALARYGPFDPEVVELGKQQKILMMPGAAWYGDYVFKPEASYDTPKGVLAAAPYPKWDGEDKNWSGQSGGGIYVVSRHSQNKQEAADIAQWMATSNEYQATAPTYPAYRPAAEAWGARLADDDFYAENPFPVLREQSALINPVAGTTRYNIGPVLTATVVQQVRTGGKISDGFPALQTQLTNLAQSHGYAVV